MNKTERYLNSGFTLIEILITMAIFISVLLVVIRFTLDISEFSVFFGADLTAEQELQISLRPIIREVRSMGPSSVGSFPIMTASADSLTFYSDSDGDGLFERIRYYMEGNIFKKGILKPSGNPLSYNLADEKTFELVHNIINGSTVFSYYNKTYTGSESPLALPIDIPSIKMIKVELSTDWDPKALPGPITFSISAMIRNFRQ